MVGTYELIVLWLSVLASLTAVGVCVYQRAFRRYVFLNLYLLTSVAFTVGCYYVYSVYGYNSTQYFYFYYAGDAIPNIVGYVLIGSFFDRLLRESVFQRYVRPTLVIFFLLVAGVSGMFIYGSVERARLFPRFVIEFEQNMYFVGVLLTFLLWISMSYLRAENRRFALLVSGLGIYFSAHATNYALRYLFHGLADVLTKVPPLAYTLMVLLWLYTFLQVPEYEPAVERATRASPREAVVRVKLSSE